MLVYYGHVRRNLWKLFPFSLTGKAKRWYNLTIGSRQEDWEALCSNFYLQFFSISRVVRLRSEILSFKQRKKESLGMAWERSPFFFNTSIWVLIGKPRSFLIRPQEACSCMSPPMRREAFLQKSQRTSLKKQKRRDQRRNPRQLNPNLYQTHHKPQLSQILNHQKRRKLQFQISCLNSRMNFLINMEIPRITIPQETLEVQEIIA